MRSESWTAVRRAALWIVLAGASLGAQALKGVKCGRGDWNHTCTTDAECNALFKEHVCKAHGECNGSSIQSQVTSETTMRPARSFWEAQRMAWASGLLVGALGGSLVKDANGEGTQWAAGTAAGAGAFSLIAAGIWASRGSTASVVFASTLAGAALGAGAGLFEKGANNDKPDAKDNTAADAQAGAAGGFVAGLLIKGLATAAKDRIPSPLARAMEHTSLVATKRQFTIVARW